MDYHVILNGKLYKFTLNLEGESLVAELIGDGPVLDVPYIIFGQVTNVPNDFREMIRYFADNNQVIFPVSETMGPVAEEFKKLGWKPDDKLYLERKEKAEEVAKTFSISDEYHTRVNGYFIHTITPEYLILQRYDKKFIPVFFGEDDEDIQGITRDFIKGSFLRGPIRYERWPKEKGITLVAY